MRPANVASQPAIFLLVALLLAGLSQAADGPKLQYGQARWDPIHFQPSIGSASNGECLTCHQEIMAHQVKAVSPAGVKSVDTKAWYQNLSTYAGEQQTFHVRHLEGEYAREVMELKCRTCHQGHDPREQALLPPDHNKREFTLRKTVNPQTCLMCHGRDLHEILVLPGTQSQVRDVSHNNCMSCHNLIRSNRHQVNFLKADAIEQAGAKDSDVCYGCHGGRQWYRIAYPYPRHAWDGMGKSVPEWAKNRPTESDPRFRLKQKQSAK